MTGDTPHIKPKTRYTRDGGSPFTSNQHISDKSDTKEKKKSDMAKFMRKED